MRDIDKIIIHCSATREGMQFDAEDIKLWHLQRGWRDIGYHYVITLDGEVQKGRADHIIGAHAKGQNKASIGICYVGGLDRFGKSKDTRTDAQKGALKALIFMLKREYPGVKIHGHNEFSSKDCPCFNVQSENY